MIILAKALIVVAIGLIVVLAGIPLVNAVLAAARKARDTEPTVEDDGQGEAAEGDPEEAAAADPRKEVPVEGAEPPGGVAVLKLHGGRTIGMLERLAVYATVLAGFPAGIAVVVAVKGLARYPELKSSDGTAEEFIIGTLASLLLACGGAGLAYWLIRVF